MTRQRQRDVPDHADEKWEYTQHTAAKHEILRRYLAAWLAILGRARRNRVRPNPLLILVDAFAGRGRYLGDEPGSPVIMFERAVRAVEDGLAERVLIRCAEPDAQNFEHLCWVCADLKHESVEIVPRRQTFVEIASGLCNWAEGKRRPPPMFVMADPFGFAGVPFDMIGRLLRIDRLEVLLTFMARDMSRFLEQPHVEGTMTEFFGGHAWRKCARASDRPACLLEQYRNATRPDHARHATPFRVFEDERKTILYYLVHLTNNDLGMREMKDAMVAKSGDMTFWPVTVRPPDQLDFDVDEPAPYATLQARIRSKYAGRRLTFLELLNDDYPDDVWIEHQYRKAVTALEKGGLVHVGRDRVYASGKPATRGMYHQDTLTFL